jgi:hypothetical protein
MIILQRLSTVVIVVSWMHQGHASILETILCVDKCVSGCLSYVTPLRSCFNGHLMFPGDPSWSGVDIIDEQVDNTSIERSFYASSNGTCDGRPTDGFVLQLNECIGPWGAPRPWGTLVVLQHVESIAY